jgi:protein required for attachment to host cells
VLANVSSGLHHHVHDIETDRQGRANSGGGQHHAFESEHDQRKLEKHDFVRAIALAIGDALNQNAFSRLAIVAPHRAIGEFRSVASERVMKTIWREVGKDFANLSDNELHNHLVPILQAPEN